MPFKGCSRQVICEDSHHSNPHNCSAGPRVRGYKGSSLDAVCPIFYICSTVFTNI